MKGIAEEIIDESLGELTDETEKLRAYDIARAKMRADKELNASAARRRLNGLIVEKRL